MSFHLDGYSPKYLYHLPHLVTSLTKLYIFVKLINSRWVKANDSPEKNCFQRLVFCFRAGGQPKPATLLTSEKKRRTKTPLMFHMKHQQGKIQIQFVVDTSIPRPSFTWNIRGSGFKMRKIWGCRNYAGQQYYICRTSSIIYAEQVVLPTSQKTNLTELSLWNEYIFAIYKYIHYSWKHQ